MDDPAAAAGFLLPTHAGLRRLKYDLHARQTSFFTAGKDSADVVGVLSGG
ncbi:hypothetical protein BLA15945_01784 [Burkholderia lata]|uniref:Uncharacterized protein n=1 Tax=Burkholderia lata (strain ATCC 17760 / DSM 23089 / LMG 22485 / NCIMB 9086 / R18194 / 383) TaxID=482957 RepID=A0A6P2J6E6_BURL3|nr:hypothetical protein BLA15945_01784 [Burkholderia lata]